METNGKCKTRNQESITVREQFKNASVMTPTRIAELPEKEERLDKKKKKKLTKNGNS